MGISEVSKKFQNIKGNGRLSLHLLVASVTALLIFVCSSQIGLSLLVFTTNLVVSETLSLFLKKRLLRSREIKGKPPFVLWLTGLSGAGKTTLAHEIVARLMEQGHRVDHLDGDSVRKILSPLGFSKEDRNRNVEFAGFLASRLEAQGISVVASFISPYEESREKVRSLCNNFKEIYVSTPLSECKKRDPKGLYAKALRNEIQNFTGVQDPYEPPRNPHLKIDTSNMNVQVAVGQILKALDL